MDDFDGNFGERGVVLGFVPCPPTYALVDNYESKYTEASTITGGGDGFKR